jgi:hypothetical protein
VSPQFSPTKNLHYIITYSITRIHIIYINIRTYNNYYYIYDRQNVCKERHLLHTVFHVLGRCTSKVLFSLLVYNIYSLDLSMAIDEDDLISDSKLFHKNTILLKCEFRKSFGGFTQVWRFCTGFILKRLS